MTNHLSAAIEPIVEDGGFTLVEEDDVAFSLSLCREVNRIYGTYLDGELAPSDPVHAGLHLTMRMFDALQDSVTDGMPSMRIEVAVAETREMLAALFGEGLAPKRLGPGQRNHEIACDHDHPSGPVLPAFQADQKEIPVAVAPAGPTSAPPPASAPPAERHQVRENLWSGYLARRAWPVRAIACLALICLAAVVLDAPLAILALFPNLFLPLTLGFVIVPLAAWGFHQNRRTRWA